jgi:hypothetical protein
VIAAADVLLFEFAGVFIRKVDEETNEDFERVVIGKHSRDNAHDYIMHFE